MDNIEPEQPVESFAAPPPVMTEVPLLPGPRPFSRNRTNVLTVLLLGAFLYGNWSLLVKGRMSLLSSPETTPLHVLHQDMSFYDGVTNLPKPIRLVMALTGEDVSEIPGDCAEMLRDSIGYLQRSTTNQTDVDELRAHLIVLLAETGPLSNAVKELSLLGKSSDTAAFRREFKQLYVTSQSAEIQPVRNFNGTNLLSGWAAWRFNMRWLEATGNQSELEEYESGMAWERQTKARRGLLVNLAALSLELAGLVALVIFIAWKAARGATVSFALGCPWTAVEMWGLFVRAYLLGVLAEGICLSLPVIGGMAWLMHMVFFGGPAILLLAWRHWLRWPCSFGQFFGLPDTVEGVAKLLLSTMALFAICWLALTWPPKAVSALGFSSHWAENIDEVLLLWPVPQRLLHIVNGAVFGPFVEEVIFRGLLFGALRTRLSANPAAAGSAIIFGLIHFYSLPGFVGVALFGFCCAMAREKTGSLLPGIFTHMLTNLLLIGGQALITL